MMDPVVDDALSDGLLAPSNNEALTFLDHISPYACWLMVQVSKNCSYRNH